MQLVEFTQASFLITGLVRNCQKNILLDIQRLELSFRSSKNVKFLLIESDSTDGSLEILNTLSINKSNFHYVSMGYLREQYPKRTDRLAQCRNKYLQLIEESPQYQNVDYIVIADMDNLNTKLSEDSVMSCWLRHDWDVCTANQTGPYYDVWALRHPLLSPNDCWEQVNFLKSLGVSPFNALLCSVYLRMIHIPIDSEWIEVQSAFGGLAIYRKQIVQNCRYVGLTDQGNEVCEHVSFHNQILSNGGKIFINPKLINSDVVTEHVKYATKFGITRLWMRYKFDEVIHLFKRLLKCILHSFRSGEKR